MQAGSASRALAAARQLTLCRGLHAGAPAAMPVTDVDAESAAHLVSTGQCAYLDVR